MSQTEFLQIQTLELERLLQEAGDDPVLKPQLEERLDELRNELQQLRHPPDTLFPKEEPQLPRAAIFLRGGTVKGSQGIRPSLAGEALVNYEKMFIEQALHDERVAARQAGRQRRPRGAPTPRLLFTGTPRGSFGLEFVPLLEEDQPGSLQLRATSLERVAEALAAIAECEAEKLDAVVNDIPARVLRPLRQFMRTLAQNGVELRLAFQDRAGKLLSAESLRGATELLEREIKQEEIEVEGTFRGVTCETGHFDLVPDEGDIITGMIADTFTEDDLMRIVHLMNRRCLAQLEKTVIAPIGRPETTRFILIDASGIDE